MITVLITGSNGLLGTALVKQAAFTDYEVVSTQVDIRNAPAVREVIEKVQPTAVLHTAAMTNVDTCELNPKLAYEINVEGTKHVAQAARSVGAKLIAVSSDYVFSGKHGPYSEEDLVGPISVYGLTKLQAERAVFDSGVDYCIARTSVLFDWYVGARTNFVTWLIDTLRDGRETNIVTDQISSPTLTYSAAIMLLALVKQNVQGIFHTAGAESLSRYEFALRIAKCFKLDASLIHPILSADLQQPAQRPIHSGLRVTKIEQVTGVWPMRVMDALDALDALRQEYL